MLAVVTFASTVASFQFIATRAVCPACRSTTRMSNDGFAGESKTITAAAAAVATPELEIPERPWFGSTPPDELEAIFFQYDADSGGDIDKDELAEALFRSGYRIPRAEFDKTFDEFDEDENGLIDLEEFKGFIKQTGLKPDGDVKFAMDLFRRYDADQGGSIDKFEFAALSNEIKANYDRRTALTALASGISALIVAKYSEEYAWTQKTFRSLYIEQKAEEAQNKYFPNALLSSDMDDAIARTLYKRGFTPQNTLFAHSVCSDEVNNKDEQLVDVMVSRWQEGFSLGGLGGLPFAGKSGFRAYLHHVPDSGKLLVLFAPHVGIDADGRVGALQRDGQSAVSKACGAAVGSYKAIQAKAEQAKKGEALPTSAVRDIPDLDNDPFDPELGIIIDLLTQRLDGLEKAEEPITFVTYQMYTIVRDLLDNCIRDTSDVWEWATELAIVGGVMINRRSGGDYFQPLSFELRTQFLADGPPTDVYAETFGARPDLVPILGSENAARRVLERSKPGENKARL